MNDIICPKCHTAFKVDEAGFAAILKQVRDQQFNAEINERLKLAHQQQASAIEIAEANLKTKLQAELLKREQAIAELQAKIERADMEKQLSVTQAVQQLEKDKMALTSELSNKEMEKKLIESNLTAKYSAELKTRDDIIKFKEEEIARQRDLKQKLSTKMIGETLEQHCEIEFNRLRATGFQKAYFEKDNDSRSGSKGDYIYREMDENGVEIISIMFEMKNEADTTATKKKNEDFLKELDKDRTEKKCEYAVLVSLLESDNELYNSGIVDVSHRHEKMYVVRPQFFIPIITLLRNAALNSLSYKQELAQMRNQNIDITHFEEKITAFKEGFARNYQLAASKFQTAIEEIDKTILHLQKTKDALLSSEKNLKLANSKAEELTIKRLTHNNPTMKAKFDALNGPTEE
ncbi:MAG: hypothetical protein RLZZ252_1639 [Bacteroidota bacterium]